MTGLILGIDPGVASGALAALSPDGVFQGVWDAPWLSSGRAGRKEPDLGGMADILAAFEGIHHAFVEFIRPFGPKLNALAVHSLASSEMAWRALLHGHGCPVERLEPKTWRAAVNCPKPKKATTTQNKHALLAKARGLYPDAPLDLVKHDGRAAALLIAEAGRRILAGAGVSLSQTPGGVG